MTDYEEARYQGNGDNLENSYGGGSSPQPRSDDQNDSKSRHGLGIMKENPLEVGKRRERKGMTRTVIAIGTGIETKKRIMIGNVVAEIVTGIVVGNAVRGGIGEEIGMMMIITAVETMTEEGTVIETGRTVIAAVPDPIQGVDLNTDQSQDLVLAHAQRGQIPGTSPTLPGVFPNMFPLATGQPFGALPVMPVQAMTQQATRHARRVYVGGLSPTANEQSVAIFFSHVMAAISGNTAGPGDAVVNVYINHEKKFAFVEMRSVEEASNAMALDGIIFEGAPVKVRRPSDYNPSLAAALGPSQPNPNLNLAAVGLSPGSAGGLEGPDRIFVGGLPYYFTEAQIRALLESFGSLRGFDLVKDRETGNSKGYAFCVYQDLSVTDIACATLNGIKMGDKTLTRLILQPQGVPTKVVCLTQALNVDDLRDDDEYEDIVEDMRQEGGKYGALVNVVIPRPNLSGEPSAGVGKAFLEYSDVEGSKKAQAAMNGRKFGGNQVIGVYYPENKFAQGGYDG
ncbi:hypothetical protein CRYUN_Cryun01aG0063400 [Craigia yunnanensis]